MLEETHKHTIRTKIFLTCLGALFIFHTVNFVSFLILRFSCFQKFGRFNFAV